MYPGTVLLPPDMKPGPHQGVRWFNNAVEATVLEMKDGTLWALARTSQDQAWQAFSKDYGETWSKPEPSRFFGTLTMNTLGRLDDGTIVSLWTNTMALPENATAGNGTWEDVFTNRDSHHIAMSGDEGKTWYGFREIILTNTATIPAMLRWMVRKTAANTRAKWCSWTKTASLFPWGSIKTTAAWLLWTAAG